jgi:trk system potassium uptake protein TrkA
MGVPRDATIVAVIRERHVIVPRGETAIAAGDEVLVLVTPESEDEVRALLVEGQPEDQSSS